MRKLLSRLEQWWLGLDKNSYIILQIYDIAMASKDRDLDMIWPAEKVSNGLHKFSEPARRQAKNLVYRVYSNNIDRPTVIRLLKEMQRKKLANPKS